MPAIKYQDLKLRKNTLAVIETANKIIGKYQLEGYELTLRQLYYQFVARDLIVNKESEYNKLGSIINNGRLAGLVDWTSIIDRTRNTHGNQHWKSPEEIVEACATSFRVDTRANQSVYIEVWVEKDALLGVLERPCKELDVRYFSCRGYVSQSAMWRAAQRFLYHIESAQGCRVIHLGDHDPSGIDMTRDIQARLAMFGCAVFVDRIALNKAQIETYKPPPNPAKVTDSRYSGYLRKHGNESWELDALDPRVITELIEDAVNQDTDQTKRKDLIGEQTEHQSVLRRISNNWDKVLNHFGTPQ